MVNRVELQHRCPVPPERIREFLTDPDYLSDKLRAVDGPRAELVSREQDERGVICTTPFPATSCHPSYARCGRRA